MEHVIADMEQEAPASSPESPQSEEIDYGKSCVVVLGCSTVQHAIAKCDKIVATHNCWLEGQEGKKKLPRTYKLRLRMRDFWVRVKEELLVEFAAEVKAYSDPHRLEQCEKKRQARRLKKRKLDESSVPNSVVDKSEPVVAVAAAPVDAKSSRLAARIAKMQQQPGGK